MWKPKRLPLHTAQSYMRGFPHHSVSRLCQQTAHFLFLSYRYSISDAIPTTALIMVQKPINSEAICITSQRIISPLREQHNGPTFPAHERGWIWATVSTAAVEGHNGWVSTQNIIHIATHFVNCHIKIPLYPIGEDERFAASK